MTYTTRATENYASEETPRDMGFDETVARAQQQAIGRAMARVADETAGFLSAPAR